MLNEQILARFRDTTPVPVVSGDPVDRPVGRWLQSDASAPDTVLIGIPFDGATVVPPTVESPAPATPTAPSPRATPSSHRFNALPSSPGDW